MKTQVTSLCTGTKAQTSGAGRSRKGVPVLKEGRQRLIDQVTFFTKGRNNFIGRLRDRPLRLDCMSETFRCSVSSNTHDEECAGPTHTWIGSRVAMQRKRSVFPTPLGPLMNRISPGPRSNEMSEITSRSETTRLRLRTCRLVAMFAIISQLSARITCENCCSCCGRAS